MLGILFCDSITFHEGECEIQRGSVMCLRTHGDSAHTHDPRPPSFHPGFVSPTQHQWVSSLQDPTALCASYMAQQPQGLIVGLLLHDHFLSCSECLLMYKFKHIKKKNTYFPRDSFPKNVPRASHCRSHPGSKEKQTEQPPCRYSFSFTSKGQKHSSLTCHVCLTRACFFI